MSLFDKNKYVIIIITLILRKTINKKHLPDFVSLTGKFIAIFKCISGIFYLQ